MIGILDPLGKNNNPLTGKPYSDSYKQLAKVWSSFPAYEKREEIIKTIKDNNVILITAATGSGKTVLVPKYTLHVLNYTGRVAVTLPKQIITKSSAEFAAKTLDVELGTYVGYKYRGSSSSGRGPDNRLLYVTDGTVVAQLMNDPELKAYDCVIVDEAHERKVQIDLLLYLLKETLKKRPDFKVIIMSATIDVEIFKDYYKQFKFRHIEIAGRTNYPIESIFLQKSLDYKDVIQKGFDTVVKIVEDKPKDENILFFVPSIKEAFDVCRKLKQLTDKEGRSQCRLTCKGDVYCVELYSGVSPKLENLAIDKDLYKTLDSYSRKLVVSTAVAESSLTVDGIKYVVDSGYELRSGYDPSTRAKILNRELITHAQAKQRMGRAGRTGPGVCYHMYTQNDFDKMGRFPKPDILVSDLTEPCLRLLKGVGTLDKLKSTLAKFIQPPKERYIKAAIDTLIKLDAVKDNKMTKLGVLIDRLNLDIEDSIALIFSRFYKCSHEMSKIVGTVDACKRSISSLFVEPKEASESVKRRYQSARKKFKHKYGDHLSILKLYQKFDDIDRDRQNNWAYDNFLNLQTLIKAKRGVSKIRRTLKREISYDLKPEDLDIVFNKEIAELPVEYRVMSCILIGYRLNTAVRRDRVYKTQYTDNVRISRDSYIEEPPRHIVFTELFSFMGKPSLNIVSKVPKRLIGILS